MLRTYGLREGRREGGKGGGTRREGGGKEERMREGGRVGGREGPVQAHTHFCTHSYICCAGYGFFDLHICSQAGRSI